MRSQPRSKASARPGQGPRPYGRRHQTPLHRQQQHHSGGRTPAQKTRGSKARRQHDPAPLELAAAIGEHLEEFFFAVVDDEILEIERLEYATSSVRPPVERLLGQRAPSPRQTAPPRQLRVGQHLGALAGTVAEDDERTSLARNAAKFSAPTTSPPPPTDAAPALSDTAHRLPYAGHRPSGNSSARVQRRPRESRPRGPRAPLRARRVERPDRQHGYPKAVTKPFANDTPDCASPCRKTEALAHGHRIELVGRNARFAQAARRRKKPTSERGRALVAFAQRDQLSVRATPPNRFVPVRYTRIRDMFFREWKSER